jgi:hypothetical protein
VKLGPMLRLPGVSGNPGVVHSLILVLAGPALSLDFSSDLVVYEEDFDGETSFSTTPEVDAIAAGGMDATSLPLSGVPILSGTAISASVSASGDGVVVAAMGSNSFGTDSFNLRGEFSALSASLDASAVVVLDAAIDSGEAFQGGIEVVLRVDNPGALVARLLVTERDGSTLGPDRDNLLEVSVPTDALAALLAGAAFVLDCQIDRAAETVTGSIDIDGFSPTIVGPMSLNFLSQTDPMTFARQVLALPTGTGTLVEVEFDSFRISQSQATIMVPALSPASLALLAAALLAAVWHRSHNRSTDTHGSTTSST